MREEMIWQVEVIGGLAVEGTIGNGSLSKRGTFRGLGFVFTWAVVGFCEVGADKGSRI